jgi:hypothetical protein
MTATSQTHITTLFRPDTPVASHGHDIHLRNEVAASSTGSCANYILNAKSHATVERHLSLPLGNEPV